MRDLLKGFDHEMKIYQFLATKGMTRVNKKQEKREELLKRVEEENNKKQHQYHLSLLHDVSVNSSLYFVVHNQLNSLTHNTRLFTYIIQTQTLRYNTLLTQITLSCIHYTLVMLIFSFKNVSV